MNGGMSGRKASMWTLHGEEGEFGFIYQKKINP